VVGIAENCRNYSRITVIDSVDLLQVVCSACCRKIKNLCDLYDLISKRFIAEQQNNSSENLSEGLKRKFLAVLSPATHSSPPNRN